MIDYCCNCLLLESRLEKEKDNSRYLKTLLKTLYGKGWEKLSISEAERCFVLKEGELP